MSYKWSATTLMTVAEMFTVPFVFFYYMLYGSRETRKLHVIFVVSAIVVMNQTGLFSSSFEASESGVILKASPFLNQDH